MKISVARFFLFVNLTVSACVEAYEFPIASEVKEGIAVEGFVSNMSYNDLLPLPQPARYFTVKVFNLGKVKNLRNSPVEGAEIELHDSMGEVYDYAEIDNGEYGLFYEDFKAQEGRTYKIIIRLSTGVVIESDFEVLPSAMPLGEVHIEELIEEKYDNVKGEQVIVELEGMNLNITTEPNKSNAPKYYKWDFMTTWIFNARRADDQSPVKYCWATSKYYLEEFVLLEDVKGDTKAELFFLETLNPRLNHGFSVLIRQTLMSEDYYSFWNEILKQKSQSELFAPPPYNIHTNVSSDELEVFGYFAVVDEKYTRWYFDKHEVENYGGHVETCHDAPSYPLSCYDCREFTYDGPATHITPTWWSP